MISQKSFSNGNFFNKNYFINTLRRKLTYLLLFGLPLFVIYSLPLIMKLSNINFDVYKDIDDLNRLKSSLCSMVGTEHVFLSVLVCILAVFVGCLANSYQTKKPSAYFVHSLPVKRHTVLLTGTLVNFIYFVAAYAINVIIVLLALGVGVHGAFLTGEVVSTLFYAFFANVMYYLLFNAISTLCGTFCGVGYVQFGISSVVICILPVLYLIYLGMFSISTQYVDIGYYTMDQITYLSPALRVLYFSVAGRPKIWEIVIFFAFALILYLLSVIIYKYRKIENASDSISFKTMLEVVKYIIVSVTALLCGVLFVSTMSESLFWLVFGVILGGFIAFLITNTILHKSARKAFKGIVGFAVLSVVLSVVSIFITFDVFGIDNYIPSEDVTSSIVLDIGTYASVEFTEKESIKTIIEFAHHMEDNSTSAKESRKSRLDYFLFGDLSLSKGESIKKIIPEESLGFVSVVFKTKFGLHVAKLYYITDKYAYFEEIKNILNSEEFSEKYAQGVDSVESGGLAISVIGSDSIRIGEEEIVREAKNYLRDIGKVDFDYFQNNSVGIFRLYKDNGSIYYVLSHDNETAIKFGVVEAYDKMIDNLVNELEEVKVIDKSDDTYETYTDKEQIRSIITSSLLSSTESGLAFTEDEYAVVFTYGRYIYVTEFLYGKIPEFVK